MDEGARLRDLLAEYTMSAAPELVRPEEGNALRCLACGHKCLIREGKAGICRVRFNEGGVLRVPGGYAAGLQVDPIEKKPFYHAYPGRDALSFGMLGCNLHCAFCQNWVSSQVLRDDDAVAHPRYCEAERVAQLAVDQGAPVVVSTYNEPLITADWALKIFEAAQARGLACGFVSNGNASKEVLEYLRPCTDLYKVDLKCFDDGKYRKLGCPLKNVLDTIEGLKALGYWVEIVTLIVPGFNDGADQLRGIAAFIAGLSVDIPWHVTAFHPDYKMTETRRTSSDDLERAYSAGKEAGLRYVYAGNLPGAVGGREHTSCPQCGAVLIERRGFHVLSNRMQGANCPDCGETLAGVWESEAPRGGNRGGPRPVAL